MNIGCVILAAGNGSRFGSNKLLASYEGKTLIQRTIEMLPREQFSGTVVVTQYIEVSACAGRYSLPVIMNRAPERGQSHSLQLGLTALKDCDGVLFTVSDQPLLERGSILSMLAEFSVHPDCIVALGHGGQRGNPCLFPRCFFPELMNIRGDRGGNTVIHAHSERLLLVEVPARQLMDVDTPEILSRLH